jgi:hypothetical protein
MLRSRKAIAERQQPGQEVKGAGKNDHVFTHEDASYWCWWRKSYLAVQKI